MSESVLSSGPSQFRPDGGTHDSPNRYTFAPLPRAPKLLDPVDDPAKTGETDYNKTVFQPYEHKPGHAIYSISREELNTVLLDELDKMKNVSINFGAKFEGINRETGDPKV